MSKFIEITGKYDFPGLSGGWGAGYWINRNNDYLILQVKLGLSMGFGWCGSTS